MHIKNPYMLFLTITILILSWEQKTLTWNLFPKKWTYSNFPISNFAGEIGATTLIWTPVFDLFKGGLREVKNSQSVPVWAYKKIHHEFDRNNEEQSAPLQKSLFGKVILISLKKLFIFLENMQYLDGKPSGNSRNPY